MSRGTRNDLDLAWKEALAAYLPEFLALFLPEVHQAIDWTHAADPLEGELRRLHRNLRGRRRHADVVVRVRRRDGQDALVILHVEAQSQWDGTLPLRMRICNDRLFDKHRLPVYSLVILGDASATWRPSRFEVDVWGCRASLDFPVLKLLDWKPRLAELERSSNPFALVVAAHLAVLETRPGHHARRERAERLVRSILERGFRQAQVDGLFHVLEAMMTMTDDVYRAFEANVARMEEEYGVKLITRSERKGMLKGREEGLQEGRRRSILSVVEARFGEVPEGLVESLGKVTDPEVLERLTRLAATVVNASDLMGELRQGAPEA